MRMKSVQMTVVVMVVHYPDQHDNVDSDDSDDGIKYYVNDNDINNENDNKNNYDNDNNNEI